MGRDRHQHKRSRSRDNSREDNKKRKRRDFSSSEQRHKSKHRKHKQHHRHEHDQTYQKYPESEQVQKEKGKEQKIVKELPCWQPSGILLHFYNARDGVSLKFHQPPEARQPIDTWKIYVFKGEQVLQPIDLVNSCYLIGKDERISDILCLNPSISRQHAVIQFRLISKMNIQGDYSEIVKPYIMDLGSTNGTFLNDQKIQQSRYVELLHKDVLRFGHSDRLYVLVKNQQAIRAANNNNQQQQ